MPVMNKGEPAQQLKPTLIKAANSALIDTAHSMPQSSLMPTTHNGKKAAFEEVNAFTKIFNECAPKASTEPVGHDCEPGVAHRRPDELRKSCFEDRKYTWTREPLASNVNNVGRRESLQDDNDSLGVDYAPGITARDDNDAGHKQREESLCYDVSIDSCTPIAPYWTQSLPAVADIKPVASPRDIEEFMSLIARHVERLALTKLPANENNESQVMISLTGSVFSQASMLLTRTQVGWSLKTMGISDENLSRIKRHAHGLVDRFAERGLGTLEFDLVDPVSCG